MTTSKQGSTTVSTSASFPDRPKLRKIERLEDRASGDPRIILHDPLGVAEAVTIPFEFAVVLDLLDGTRTVAQVGQSMRMRLPGRVQQADLQAFVEDLSEAGWLDDPQFERLRMAQVEAFEGAAVRAPIGSGLVYPDQRGELLALLDAHIGPARRTIDGSDVVGVMLPHGPPEMVGSIIDRTLQGLPAANDLDLVVVLGTDHGRGLLPFVASPKPYATLLGETQVATSTFEALQRRVPWIAREALRHRHGLSIELAHLYLQYVYGANLPPVLCVLCGPQSLGGSTRAERDAAIAALESLTEDRRVLWCASAELSHTGPAYGDRTLDVSQGMAIEAHDRACLEALGRGSSTSLTSRCHDGPSAAPPSGAAVMTTLVDLLPSGFRTDVAAYERTPVPGPTPGHCGLAGIRFRKPRSARAVDVSPT